MEAPHTISHFFFFNDTATTEIYTLSLHDALPICSPKTSLRSITPTAAASRSSACSTASRSEEHTSELQSPCNLVCRLLLEKKKATTLPISLSLPLLPASDSPQHLSSTHTSRRLTP